MGFERVKTGTLSVPEFNEYLKEIRDSSYNSLVISAEIVPVLNENMLQFMIRLCPITTR